MFCRQWLSSASMIPGFLRAEAVLVGKFRVSHASFIKKRESANLTGLPALTVIISGVSNLDMPAHPHAAQRVKAAASVL